MPDADFQLALFDQAFDDTPLVTPPTAPGAALTLKEKFELFHAANPQVYQNLRTLCYSWIRNGHRKAGIDTLFGVLRWQSAINTTGHEGYKLNNNLKAYYARELMKEPPLAGMFDIRGHHDEEETNHED
jgi:hypothetical protein